MEDLTPPTIRGQLVALVLAAALPVAALLAWILFAGAQRDAEQARAQVLQLAEMTASETAGFVGQVHNILKGLAERPAVRALDPARCDPMLREFLALAPRFSNAVTLRIDGEVVCSGAPAPRGVRLDPGKLLERMQAPGELAIGKATPGTITRRWAVPVGLAIAGADGAIAGAVALPVDLLRLPVHARLQGSPQGLAAGLVDADGTVLAHSAEPARFIGTNSAERPETQAILERRRGIDEAKGLDGVVRIRAYAPVAGTGWIAVASVPAAEVYAPGRARALQSALLALGVLAAALLLAGWWSRRLRAPIAALAGTAAEIAAGNLAARASPAGSREIAEVGVQFNRMLDARQRAVEALREAEARQREVLDNMFPFVGLLSLDGRVLEANRAPLEAAGIRREDVVGRFCAETPWFAWSGRVQERVRAALARAAAGETVRYDETIRIAGGRCTAIDLMFSPLRDGAGRAYRIVGSAVDISERKAAEVRVQAYGQEMQRLSRRLIEVEETERRAFSHELHDRIGQNLATLGLNLKLVRAGVAPGAPAAALARIDDAHALLDATTRQARDLMAELHPPALEDYGLAAALRAHAESFGERVGMRVAFAGEDLPARLAPAVELALFRIAQEALANAAKYAHAGEAEVRLEHAHGRVTLAISDAGVGFDALRPRRSRSWGLAIMRERAAAAGVELHVDSAPGRGTRVRAEVALDAHAALEAA